MSEFDLHKSPESGIGLPIGTVNKAGGELKIREATHLEKGVMARVNRMLSRADEFTLAPISRNIESLESAAAYYYGLKKLWPGMWGSLFNPIPPDIARSLANIDPYLPSALNAAFKNSMNKAEVMSRIVGASSRFDPAFSLDSTASALKMDPDALKDLLSPVYEKLSEYLSNVSDTEGVNAAFERIEYDIQRHLETMTMDELKQLLLESKETIKGEGLGAAVKAVDAVSMLEHEHIINHFRFYQEVLNTAEFFEADGASKAKILIKSLI